MWDHTNEEHPATTADIIAYLASLGISTTRKTVAEDAAELQNSGFDMVWNSDAYYVCGYSESHGKVVTFRVDRMCRPELSESVFCPRSEGYDIGKYCRRVFSMYDGADCTVELKCENSLMDDIVDRFGEQVQTGRYDTSHFTARVQVSVSPTFYAGVFTYGGQIEILSPEPVRREYAQRLQAALKQAK